MKSNTLKISPSDHEEEMLLKPRRSMRIQVQEQQKILSTIIAGSSHGQPKSQQKQGFSKPRVGRKSKDQPKAPQRGEGEHSGTGMGQAQNQVQERKPNETSNKEKMLKEKIADFDDHVIITSLGQFFQIDGYTGLFTRIESLKAKNLILMVSKQMPEFDISAWIDQLRAVDANFIRDLEKQKQPPLPISNKKKSTSAKASQKRKISDEVDADNEHDQPGLLLYPFAVVGHLLKQYNPVDMSTESALTIRQQALFFGIIELLLKLLTQQAYQQPIRRSAGSGKSKNKKVRAVSVDAATEKSDAAASAAASASHLPKGTGYADDYDGYKYWMQIQQSGSKSKQKELNVEMHEAAENNIASLLDILTAYINPNNIYENDDNSTGTADPEEVQQQQPRSGYNLRKKMPSIKRLKLAQNAKKHQQIHLTMTEEFIELLHDYSIFTTLNAYLINDSVFYISKMVHLFNAIVSFIMALAKSSPIKLSNTAKFEQFCDAKTLAEPVDILTILLATDQDKATLFDQLKKLGENIKNYLDKLRTWSQLDPSGDEEELAKLLKLVNGACSIIGKKFRMDEQEQKNKANNFGQQQAEEPNRHATVDYCQLLKGLQIKTIPFYEAQTQTPSPKGKGGTAKATLCLPYHFASSLTDTGQSSSAGIDKRTRRLAQEIASLNNSLSLSENGSIFVRTSEERLDVMKVMIVGPTGTPYANGCFEFDVFFPANYPNVPMKINLETTGNKKVRFNPNLYDYGKVCLSLLNTWHGRPEESWNAATSTLLQVLVSIQSLIFVDEPFFNEPGFTSHRSKPEMQKASLEYTQRIREECIHWAMVEQLRNLSSAFSDVIQAHFWLKREEICDQIAAWIADAAGSPQKHLTALNEQYKTLKEEFARMPCPDGLVNHVLI